VLGAVAPKSVSKHPETSGVGDSVGAALDGGAVAIGCDVGLNVSPAAVGEMVVGDMDGAGVVTLSQFE